VQLSSKGKLPVVVNGSGNRIAHNAVIAGGQDSAAHRFRLRIRGPQFPMLRSMTGFGRAEVTQQGVLLTAEVLSLNNRFLEITCRLPRLLASREWQVRELVRESLSRGTVTVTLSVQWLEAPVRSFSPKLAQAYYRMLQQLVQVTGMADQPRLEHLLRFAELFDSGYDPEAEERLWQAAQQALRKALGQLQQMRRTEGKNLAADIRHRLRTIERIIGAIARRSTERISEAQQQLRKRVAALLQDVPDPQRLYQEFALMADRLDVSEECTRLRSHLQLLRQLLREREPVGRRMTFLLQEMQREANTIGAKANDAPISHWVVQLKEELERIREQAQNIE